MAVVDGPKCSRRCPGTLWILVWWCIALFWGCFGDIHTYVHTYMYIMYSYFGVNNGVNTNLTYHRDHNTTVSGFLLTWIALQ